MGENQTKFVVDDANAKVYVPSTDTKFGIGTDSPNERLHVVGNIFATGNVSGSATSTGSFGQIQVGTSNAGYRAKITSTGDVDIRGTDPVQTISFGSNRPVASTTTLIVQITPP